MESERFDRLARRWGTARMTRAGVLRGGALAAMAALGVARIDDAAARKSRRKNLVSSQDDGGPNPAQNETQCGRVNGDFQKDNVDDPDNANTCTVSDAGCTVTGYRVKEAGNSGNAWTVDVTQTSTITYRFGGSCNSKCTPVVEEASCSVTACKNPGGHSVNLTDGNCQLSEEQCAQLCVSATV